MFNLYALIKFIFVCTCSVIQFVNKFLYIKVIFYMQSRLTAHIFIASVYTEYIGDIYVHEKNILVVIFQLIRQIETDYMKLEEQIVICDKFRHC